jgi:hypothetical protein
MKTLTVFTLRVNDKTKTTVWIRVGKAAVNQDGSINVYLDALPLDGTLHIRETADDKSAQSPGSGS